MGMGGHGSQGLFTQVGFTDPSQDENHFGVAPTNSLQTQVASYSYSCSILLFQNPIQGLLKIFIGWLCEFDFCRI